MKSPNRIIKGYKNIPANLTGSTFYTTLFPYVKIEDAFDVETTGLDAYVDKAKIFSYSRYDGENMIIQRTDEQDALIQRENLQVYFDDYSISKICHNVKYEISEALNNGFKIHPLTVWHDTMIMSQMLHNQKKAHGLDVLAKEFFSYDNSNDKLIAAAAKLCDNYQQIDKKLMYDYQVDDAIRGLLLFKLFLPELEDLGMMQSYFYEIEYIKVVQQMEQRGIMVHKRNCEEIIKFLSSEIEIIQKEIHNLFGFYINPNSEKQLNNVFFNILKFPILSFTDKSMGKERWKIKSMLERGDTGESIVDKFPNLSLHPSVDKNYIFKLQENGFSHDFLELVIKYRTYVSGRTTIINGYLGGADKDLIVRPSIKSNEDTTGRSASVKPNIQNVSKEKALLNLYPIPARKCWRPRPGFFFDFADYGQIELRLVIAICKDPILFAAVNNGEDTHAVLADQWYNEVKITNEAILGERYKKYYNKLIKFSELDPSDGFKKLLRNSSKNANFGLPFGAQIVKLCETLGIDEKYVLLSLNRIKKIHGPYFNFTNVQKAKAKVDGFVTTLFNRRLFIDLGRPWSAANYAIQGTAAEILKRGLVKVYQYFITEWGDYFEYNKTTTVLLPTINLLNKNDYSIPTILAPIHDEAMMEKSRSLLQYDNIILPKVAELLTTGFAQIPVPLTVEYKRTFTNWNDAKPIDFNGNFLK